MQEYLENGARLGWLIDPVRRSVYVYRPGIETERFDHPKLIAAEPLLAGCVLHLEGLWPVPTS